MRSHHPSVWCLCSLYLCAYSMSASQFWGLGFELCFLCGHCMISLCLCGFSLKFSHIHVRCTEDSKLSIVVCFFCQNVARNMLPTNLGRTPSIPKFTCNAKWWIEEKNVVSFRHQGPGCAQRWRHLLRQQFLSNNNNSASRPKGLLLFSFFLCIVNES